ncbi:MAG: putative acyltransferase [Fibrobacteres bacterium]|nr:putative acyltransferase [Fibrobacterota bacterium]
MAGSLKRQLSIYLDLIRVLAALFVFLDHTPSYTGGFLWRFSGIGHQCVMFFFVLSGFVIAYVTDTKEKEGSEYAINRMARIYSVALPGLILTIALFYLGKAIDPTAFANLDGKLRLPGQTIVLALTFLNQSWTPTIVFSNIPYWSLGFEVLYYFFFGLCVFTTGRRRLVLIAFAMLIMGPSVCLDLPIWLMGVACYKAQARWRMKLPAGIGLFSLSIPLIATFMYSPLRERIEHGANSLINPWILGNLYPPAIHFAPDYLLGLAVALNIFAFAQLCGSIAIPKLIGKGIQRLASYTFSLYLFHMPLISFASLIFPYSRSHKANLFACMVATPSIIVALGNRTERQKSLYKDFFAWILMGKPRMAVAKVPIE